MVRVAAELERARDLEREVKARLRPLSIQATAADRAAKLAGEIAVGRVTLLSSEMLTEQRSSAGLDGRRASAAETHAAVEKKLEALAARRAHGRVGADRSGRGPGTCCAFVLRLRDRP